MFVFFEKWVIGFYERYGCNVIFINGNKRVVREGDIYDYGMVFSDRLLYIGEVFQFKIEELELKWVGFLVCKDYMKC